MSTFFVSCIMAFFIGFTGTGQQAPEAPVQPAAAQQVVEQDPILVKDAAATLADYKTTGFTDKDGDKFVPIYVGTDDSSDNMFGEFTLESIDFPGKFHHFTYGLIKTT
jgi:hypothetical protein